MKWRKDYGKIKQVLNDWKNNSSKSLIYFFGKIDSTLLPTRNSIMEKWERSTLNDSMANMVLKAKY